jgi:hypothetical protein
VSPLHLDPGSGTQALLRPAGDSTVSVTLFQALAGLAQPSWVAPTPPCCPLADGFLTLPPQVNLKTHACPLKPTYSSDRVSQGSVQNRCASCPSNGTALERS